MNIFSKKNTAKGLLEPDVESGNQKTQLVLPSLHFKETIKTP